MMNMEENSNIRKKQKLLKEVKDNNSESGKLKLSNKKSSSTTTTSTITSNSKTNCEDRLHSIDQTTNGQQQQVSPENLILKKDKPKRKLRKPTAEEDIVDGYSILAFKNYDELTRAIKLGEGTGSLCVQLLKRAEDGSVCKSVRKNSPKSKNSSLTTTTSGNIKFPQPKSSTTPKKRKTMSMKMANKLPSEGDGGCGSGSEDKKRSQTESPAGNPKKQRTNGTPSSSSNKKKQIHIADGRAHRSSKDSSQSPHLLDNLQSSHEYTNVEPIQRSHLNHNKEVIPISPPPVGKITPTLNTSSPPSPTTTGNLTPTTLPIGESKLKTEVIETSLSIKSVHSNGPTSLEIPNDCLDLNGNSSGITETSESSSQLKPTQQQQTLFTPYAQSAITRVSTPLGIPDVSNRDHYSPKHTNITDGNGLNHTSYSIAQQIGLNDFSTSGSQTHYRPSSPYLDKTGIGTGSSTLTSSVPHLLRNSATPTSIDTSTTHPVSSVGKSTTFGSIARLLHSPNPSSTRSSPTTISASTTVTHSTNYSNSLNQFFPSQLSGGGIPLSIPQSCSSRSLSPRSHSPPPRERDSYSSNVSSLSRSSITPVSGSSSTSQLPPNLSPLPSLSYSKAASWLSGVASGPGPSPIPRPTPPPPTVLPPSSSSSSSSSTGHLSGSGGLPALTPGPPTPLSLFSNLVPQPSLAHAAISQSLPTTSTSAMFAPPILPLSSIMSHPSSQPVPYGTPPDQIFPGGTQSELVRRDLESRFLGSERLGNTAGPVHFLPRPSDLHPHHQLLSHLSGVNLSPHNHTGSSPALFPPPLFKDLKLDSPFYRNLSLSYPGFNGILPPHNLPTPFTSPNQLPSFTPKKTGKWNAMHVRIAWEIYQHQQKGGVNNENKSSYSPTTNPASSNSSSSNVKNTSNPTNHSSTASTDLLRPSNHLFSGINRQPPDVGPGFGSPLLSPHQQQPSRGPYDASHSLFLPSPSQLGSSLPRYPGFGPLGPTFGALGSIGSSLLGRDLSNLGSLPPHEQWQRLQRSGQYHSGIGLPGWPLTRPERESKSSSSVESRRSKEDRIVEKRHESERHSDSRGSLRGDISPFRDRSPLRSSRLDPIENGDTDSRSSRSSDSHSTTVQSSTKARFKDDLANGDNSDKSSSSHPIGERERDKGINFGFMNEMKLNYMSGNHPSRLFHPGSSMIGIAPGWESIPGYGSMGPRLHGTDPFRFGLLPLSERDKEYSSRLQSSLLIRPPHYPLPPPNGPFINFSIGGLPQFPQQTPIPPNLSSSTTGSNKNSPLGSSSSTPIPLLNPLSHYPLHHSTSQNGSNSPSNKSEDRVKEST